MKVLVACEESQEVCKAFRKLGHEAYSCDILACSGNHPEWHIQGDVLEIMGNGDKRILLQNGDEVDIQSWDLMIAHPPCTYLAVAGNRSFLNNPKRWKQRLKAINFVYELMNAPIPKIALENPVSVISSHIRKSDQIIHPWQFGDKEVKKTCLWLKNLPHLKPTKIVEPNFVIYNSSTHKSGKSRYPTLWKGTKDSRERSKTFPGIAAAMAKQWGKVK